MGLPQETKISKKSDLSEREEIKISAKISVIETFLNDRSLKPGDGSLEG